MAIRPSNKTRKSKFLQRWSGTAYVMPSFAILLLIALIPILYTAYLSFTKYDVLSDPVWYGTANYEKLATDQKFWSAMKNTVIYTVFTVPLQIFIPMLLADVLAKTEVKWLSSFVRSVLFVPVVASLILVGTVWRYMLSGDTGFFNSVLATVGIDQSISSATRRGRWLWSSSSARGRTSVTSSSCSTQAFLTSPANAMKPRP